MIPTLCQSPLVTKKKKKKCYQLQSKLVTIAMEFLCLPLQRLGEVVNLEICLEFIITYVLKSMN